MSDSTDCSRRVGQEAAERDRRSFLSRVSLGLSGLIAATLAVPPLAYVLAPVLKRNTQRWRGVGPVEKFEVGKTELVSFDDASSVPWAGVTTKTGAWLRRVDESEFIAFSINCRHLGCPVRWLDDANLFMCPCHGGVYYADGSVAGGPPPEPLARIDVRVSKGQVQLQTTPVPLTTTDI